MKTRNTRFLIVSLATTAVLGAAVLGRPTAAGFDQPRPAPAVVSINLARVLDGLDETQIIRQRLAAMDAEIDSYRADAQQAIEALEAERGQFERGGERFLRKHEEILTATANLGAWLQVKTGLREMEETREYLRMYDRILGAAQALAEANGYDFILLDDTNLSITPGTPSETVAQLFTRRMIYANPQRDATADLIDRMNNAYQAGED